MKIVIGNDHAGTHYKEAIIAFLKKENYEVINVGAERSEERRVGKECRSRWSPYH